MKSKKRKFIVKFKNRPDAEHLYTGVAKNGMEYVRVRYSNYKTPKNQFNIEFYELNVYMHEVVGIYKAKSKFRRKIDKKVRSIKAKIKSFFKKEISEDNKNNPEKINNKNNNKKKPQ